MYQTNFFHHQLLQIKIFFKKIEWNSVPSFFAMSETGYFYLKKTKFEKNLVVLLIIIIEWISS